MVIPGAERRGEGTRVTSIRAEQAVVVIGHPIMVGVVDTEAGITDERSIHPILGAITGVGAVSLSTGTITVMRGITVGTGEEAGEIETNSTVN